VPWRGEAAAGVVGWGRCSAAQAPRPVSQDRTRPGGGRSTRSGGTGPRGQPPGRRLGGGHARGSCLGRWWAHRLVGRGRLQRGPVRGKGAGLARGGEGRRGTRDERLVRGGVGPRGVGRLPVTRTPPFSHSVTAAFAPRSHRPHPPSPPPPHTHTHTHPAFQARRRRSRACLTSGSTCLRTR
jgi:hypothetical protein